MALGFMAHWSRAQEAQIWTPWDPKIEPLSPNFGPQGDARAQIWAPGGPGGEGWAPTGPK